MACYKDSFYISGKIFYKSTIKAEINVNIQPDEMYKYQTKVQTYFSSYLIWCSVSDGGCFCQQQPSVFSEMTVRSQKNGKFESNEFGKCTV
jgi:hypothetical protein